MISRSWSLVSSCSPLHVGGGLRGAVSAVPELRVEPGGVRVRVTLVPLALALPTAAVVAHPAVLLQTRHFGAGNFCNLSRDYLYIR